MQLTLPQDAWDDLVRRLTNENPLAEAFIEDINKDIHIHHNGDRIIVESEKIDEESILRRINYGH